MHLARRSSSIIRHTQKLDNGSLLISPVQASHDGTYTCELLATTGANHLPPRLEHRVIVLGVRAPDAPEVSEPPVSLADAAGAGFASASSALQLEWLSSSTHGSPLTGFTLSCAAERSVGVQQYASLPASLDDEMRKWNESRSELEGCAHNVTLGATARTHRFRALRCGASYSFGVAALNARGASTTRIVQLKRSRTLAAMPLAARLCTRTSIARKSLLLIFVLALLCSDFYSNGTRRAVQL